MMEMANRLVRLCLDYDPSPRLYFARPVKNPFIEAVFPPCTVADRAVIICFSHRSSAARQPEFVGDDVRRL